MSELCPCTGCRRHVRADETACPFCGATVTTAPRRPKPGARLSRAAVFAGALATAAAAGCQKDPPPSPKDPHDVQQDQQQQDDDQQLPVVAIDAAPIEQPPDAAPVADTPDAAVPVIRDHPIPKPYGAPPARRRLV